MKKSIKILSVLLSLCMLLAFLPTVALAVDEAQYQVWDANTETTTFCVGTRDGNTVTRANGETVSGTSVTLVENSFRVNVNSQKVIFLDPIAITSASFSGVYIPAEIQGLSYLNTAQVTSMFAMFSDSGFKSLDLSNFNTEKVTDMTAMFYMCSGRLTSLDLRSFNTEKVESLLGMFLFCSNLKTLDLSSFVVGENTNTDGMFYGCDALSSLTLGTGFRFNDGHAAENNPDAGEFVNACLPDVPSNEEYTGYWVCADHPGLRLTSQNLMATYDGATMAGTWKWERVGGEPTVDSDGTWAVYDETNQTLTFCTGTKTDAGVERTADGTVSGDQYYTGLATTAYDKDNRPPWETAPVVKAIFLDEIAPVSTAWWFSEDSLTEIEGLSFLKTDNVTNMECMFEDCRLLTALDLSEFNTGNVTNMRAMFFGCRALETLNVSRFNTEKVTDMSDMFAGCAFTYLDVRNFRIGNTNLEEMFSGCRNLTGLDLGAWDLTNVINVNDMFADCTALALLKIGENFRFTAEYYDEDSGGTVSADAGLATASDEDPLTVYHWYRLGDSTPYAVDDLMENYDGATMAGTWYRGTTEPQNYAVYNDADKTLTFCFGMRSGNTVTRTNGGDPYTVSGTRVYSVTDSLPTISGVRKIFFSDPVELAYERYMFSSSSLKEIQGFSHVIFRSGMAHLFYYCTELTSLDLSGFNTASATSMAGMFHGCAALTGLDLGSFHTENVADMSSMFTGCTRLTGLDLSSFNTENVLSMLGMFAGCTRLTGLDLSNFHTENVTNMTGMFTSCSRLTSLDLSSFVVGENTNTDGMFYGCDALSSLTLGTGFRFNDGHATENNLDAGEFVNACLSDVPVNEHYTGYWVCADHPDLRFTSQELMDNYDGATMAGTWVWETKNEPAPTSICGAKVSVDVRSCVDETSDPVVTVVLNDTTLSRGTDYTVDYTYNAADKTATVTVTGIGAYTDTTTFTFKIADKGSNSKSCSLLEWIKNLFAKFVAFFKKFC